MQTDFTNITYLKKGNQKQQAAYDLLVQYTIMDQLQQFDPVLVGTIPIGIDTDKSDLDIICCFNDQSAFEEHLQQAFGQHSQFNTYIVTHLQQLSVVANFYLANFEIEIFGQHIPTQKQYAYRHMIIEDRLLKKYGEAFRKQVIDLKTKGHKTEPAFALLLELQGDPYEALLQFSSDIGSV